MSVSALHDLLAAHARGDLDEDALLQAAPRPIRAAGAEAARAALLSARDDGRLPAALYERLLATIEETAAAEADGDRTRLIPGGTRTATGDHADADADMTRVLPGGTAGVARAHGEQRVTSGSTPEPSTTSDNLLAGDTDENPADDDDPTAVAAATQGASTTSPTATTNDTADADRTAVVSPPGESPTAADKAPSTQDSRELGVGDEIKGRFRLLERLGQGGMGTIWKAVDKRREEARDRNPYIAIKLLAGDFKNHPEAFIALQRECAKQQRLAHPNIATVYDFDRDGDTVYMTMVLLEGQPLDAFVRALPKGGLPPEEVMPIIEQLAAGLAYAHENGLVHSDLKPGNCYLLEDGNVRLLDFGIARASRTREDASGETTVFDPGQLGALTPTYATVEMFDGQDPDPRDDIYALGIITYQLLTGEHPYGKKSAPKAMQLGLVPAPVASLDKRQNRGLRRSLAFLREERTPTVAEFLADLRPRKSRVVPIAISIVVTLLVVAALAWKPVQDYLRKQENDEIIAVFMRGDEASINAGLARVEALPDPTQRQEIAEDPRTRDAIIGLYVQRRREHFDPAAGRYDYAAGERQMELLAQLYPDSAEVLRTRNEYRAERDRLLAQLDTRLRDLLRQGRLLPDADGEDVADLLDIVHSVDPESPLLHDAGVAAAYVAAAGEASAAGDWRRALELLETGDALSPGDEKLAVALTEVRAELERQGKATRVQALRERWQPRLSTLGEASALDAAEAELTELQELAPSEALFTQLEPIVDPLLEQRVTTLLAAGDAAAARELLERQGRFASVAMLETLRARLGAASAPRGDAVAAGATLDEWLAREPDDAGRWSGGLATALKILLSRTSAGDPQAVTRQAAVAERLQTLSRAALDAERFEESARWLALGERLAPTDAQRWQATRESLAAARTAASERAAAAARAKRLADLRERVQTLAAAGDGRAAREALAAYAREAGETDEYTREGGPRAVAGAYLAMADAAAGAEEALVVVREGLEVAPHETTLREREQALAARVLERALTLAVRTQPTPTTAPPTAAGAVRAAPAAALDDGVSTVDAVRGHPPAYPALGDNGARDARDMLAKQAALTRDLAAVRIALADYDQLYPQAGDAAREQVGSALARAIAENTRANRGGLDKLRQTVADFRTLFPAQWSTLREAAGSRLRREIEKMQGDDLPRAHNLLALAREVLPGSSALDQARLKALPKPSRYAPTGLEQIAAGKLSAAQQTFAKMIAEEPDHEQVPVVRAALEKRLAEAREYHDAFKKFLRARRKREGEPYLKRALALWVDNTKWRSEYTQEYESKEVRQGACNKRLAGYGRRSRGTCYDEIPGGGRGPVLVVVPAGGAIKKPFAIGKFEISVGEFNQFCKQSGSCKPLAGDNASLPVTGIRVDDADQYTRWLSEQTGAVYRLPTTKEWTHAANAGGKQPRKDFNCRVTSGGDIIKGHGLVDAQSGQQNGWGLANYVGNAQEWVRDGSKLRARGGAFEDPLARCEPGLSRTHNGNADGLTGFRVLRELP